MPLLPWVLQVLFGLQFAYDIGATFVLDIQAIASAGVHGGYSWFDQYSGLSYNEMTLEYVTERYKPTVVQVCPAYDALKHIAKHGDAACNTLYILQSTGCCSYMHGTQDTMQLSTPQDCWFFDCTRGVSEHLQPIMIDKYEKAQSHSATLLDTVYDKEEYNVAIHIRTGDIQLHIGDTQFFTHMIRSIVHAHLSHMPVHIYYIGQFGVSNNSNTMTESPTADWSFLNKLHVNTSFYNPDEQTALHHFIHADMTIITGSSFPYLAMAGSNKPIYVASVPKAGTAAFHYIPQSTATQYVIHNLDSNGNLDVRRGVNFESVIAQHLSANDRIHLLTELCTDVMNTSMT
jgi:hypothetical protein